MSLNSDSNLSSVHQMPESSAVTTRFPFDLSTQWCFSKEPPIPHCFTSAPKYSAIGPFPFSPCVILSGSSNIASVLIVHMETSLFQIFKISAFALKNVQLKPNVARRRFTKLATLASILKHCNITEPSHSSYSGPSVIFDFGLFQVPHVSPLFTSCRFSFHGEA